MLASLHRWRHCLCTKVKFWQRICDNERRKPPETPSPHSLRAFAARVAAPPLKPPANKQSRQLHKLDVRRPYNNCPNIGISALQPIPRDSKDNDVAAMLDNINKRS